MPVPHFSIPSWLPHIDVLIVGLFAALVAIDAMRNGTRRAIAFSLAGPLALFVMALLPQTAFIDSILKRPGSTVQVAIFGSIFLALFFLIFRMCGQYGISGAYPISAIVAGIAATIVLIIVWLQVPGLLALWPLPALFHRFFMPAYGLYWLMSAYVALALSKK